METIRVFWREKFNNRAVVINEADFDPAIHRVGEPWGQGVALTEDVAATVDGSATEDPNERPKAKGRPKRTEE